MTEELELQRRMVIAMERMAENFPDLASTRFFSADTDTCPASSTLTVTFSISWKAWKIKVTELYCDARTDCTYIWYFAGEDFDFNQVEFDWGMKAVEDTYHDITLVVTNASLVDVEVGYYVKGFAMHKGN